MKSKIIKGNREEIQVKRKPFFQAESESINPSNHSKNNDGQKDQIKYSMRQKKAETVNNFSLLLLKTRFFFEF
jgi:hypothetical protein